MRGERIDRAFVTSLITGLVFVLFKWRSRPGGASGRSSSQSLIRFLFLGNEWPDLPSSEDLSSSDKNPRTGESRVEYESECRDCSRCVRLLHCTLRETNLPSSTRREQGVHEAWSSPPRCFNKPTQPSLSPLLLTAASTDMPGRYRYGLCTAADGEINGCVKGDDPQLIRSCLTLLPLVAGPGCCIPGGLPRFLTRKFSQALKRSASLHVFVVRTCGPDSERRRAEGLDFICESSQVMLISRRVRPVNLDKKTRL